MTLQIVDRPSPNHDERAEGPIDILVLHYTGMRTAEEALARLCDPAAKVSAHYTVDRDGSRLPACCRRSAAPATPAFRTGRACAT